MINLHDQVTLVNDADEVVGQEDKIEAHRGAGQLHRAISVFLFNSLGQLLIQQRSAKKIVAANLWANTACGNVRPNESYEDCAYRRLREELGIKKVKLQKIDKFQYSVPFSNGFSEREIDTVFVGPYDGEVEPDLDQVQDYKWIKFKDLFTLKDQKNFAPWVAKLFEQESIVNQLQKFLQNVR